MTITSNKNKFALVLMLAACFSVFVRVGIVHAQEDFGGDIGTFQPYADQSDTFEPYANQLGTFEPYADQSGTFQPYADQSGTFEPYSPSADCGCYNTADTTMYDSGYGYNSGYGNTGYGGYGGYGSSYGYSTPIYSSSYYTQPVTYTTPTYRPTIVTTPVQQRQVTSNPIVQPINIVNNNVNTNTNTNTNTAPVTPVYQAPMQYPVVYNYPQPITPTYIYTPPVTYPAPIPLPPPVVLSCSITVSPGTVANGQPAYLNWTSVGAQSAWMSDSIGSVAPSGTIAVRPESSRTYTLTVNGFGGTRTCNTYLNVGAPFVSLTQIPYTGFDFGPFGNAIYWTSLALFALALGYLAVYYLPAYRSKRNAFAFATQTSRASSATRVTAKSTLETPSLFSKKIVSARAVGNLPVADAAYVPTNQSPKDSMAFTESGEHMAPRIVITRG